MFALLITLVLTITTNGIQITVQSDSPAQVYIQAENAEPAIRLCTLSAGESCGFTAHAGVISTPVRVRVWDGASAPSADQSIAIPVPHRVYLPL